MKKSYLFYYALMIFINALPFIPLSLKGILGLFFIIISCVKLSFKDGVTTTAIWIAAAFINYILGVNVDYKYGIIEMFLGTLIYCIIAFYIGRSTENLRQKNNKLKDEIEKRENIEKELEGKIALLQNLMDMIPSPIFFKDLNCRYMGCNRTFENSMGIIEKDLVGKTVYDLYDKDLADEFQRMDTELLENKGKQVYETVIQDFDGSSKNIIFSKTIFNDEIKNSLGIVCVMTDITDKKESEKLKQSIYEILEKDKLKTEFFSNISHELRTPLNVILGAVQLMELYTKDSQITQNQSRIIKNLAVMRQNCYRLLRLVNNLIDITKIDAHAFEIHLKNCNIVSIIEEITLSVSDYIELKRINLVFDTDAEEKIIACDEEKMERIMLNILSNAVKFTKPGGSILVNIRDMGESICISVSDTGIGIPEDKKNEIFQRFCQINDMFTKQYEGSGIGLSLVKSIVEMHRGNITVDSQLGQGTTFAISLPVYTIDDNALSDKPIERQTQVERINVEFSDIYSSI